MNRKTVSGCVQNCSGSQTLLIVATLTLSVLSPIWILPAQASSPPESWVLLATDPDEGAGTSLREIYGQVDSGILYFKVVHYRPWTEISEIDTGILLDTDQDLTTGLPEGSYPDQNMGIGADYLIVVGDEGNALWNWDESLEWWDMGNVIELAYLWGMEDSNVFVVGVYLSDIEPSSEAIDCAVADPRSSWDWMPDTGYFTCQLISAITASVGVHPEALNLKSRGKWIMGYIELPEDYDVNDINVSTIMLNDTIPAELHPTEIGDYDADGILDLMVKFDRVEVMALLSVGEATLTITGEVSGIPFEGSVTIRVIGE